jgi:uncharacterized membrane protein
VRITKGAGMTVENNPLRAGRQARGGLSRKSPACQRGALGILGAVTLLLSVLFTALAVDTGRLMLEQRRLQSVADMAALDASSQSGSCGDGKLSTAQAAAEASAARNHHPVGGTRTLAVALGNTSTGADGVRVFAASAPETATSVEVIAGNTVPASLFAGGMLGEQATLQARAVAERQALAGFSAGSGLVSLNSEDSALLNSLLGGVLGSTVDLGVDSYEGIASTNVTLLELVKAEATVGSVAEFLDSELTLGELLQIYADAVNASGALGVGAIIADKIPIAANVSELVIKVSDILAITTDPELKEAAALANINLLSLITTTALIANGENALALFPTVNLLGITISPVLKVIEPPQIAIGPPGKDENGKWHTQMHTAQVLVEAEVNGDVNLGLAQAIVDLSLQIKVAQGSAWLKSIQCRNQENAKSIITIGAQPGIASVALAQATDPDASAAHINLYLLSILGIHLPLANVTAGLDVTLADPDYTELIYEVGDNNEWPMVQRASSSVGGSLDSGLADLADSVQIDVELLGLGLGIDAIVELLLNVLLKPLFALLGDTIAPILEPLLKVLGIGIGYMDVQLFKLDVDSHRPTLLV